MLTLILMSVLAHYGGIDEVGVFVIPVVLLLLGMRWLEKRAQAKASSTPEDGGDGDD